MSCFFLKVLQGPDEGSKKLSVTFMYTFIVLFLFASIGFTTSFTLFEQDLVSGLAAKWILGLGSVFAAYIKRLTS